MTRPIPPGAPRKRGMKACIACRSVKSKCLPDDTPDASSSRWESSERSQEKSCQRCIRLDLDCQYAPSRRFGRPMRKVPKSATDTQSSPEAWQVSTPLSDQNHQTHALVLQSESSSSTINDDSSTSSKAQGSSADLDHVDDSPFNQQLILPLLISPDVQSVDCPYFTAILNEYKLNVHHYIPIFPSDERDLERTIRTAPPLLMSAILNIAYPISQETFDVTMINPVLSDLQAAVLLAIVFYGQNDWQTAQSIVYQAASCLISLRPKLTELEKLEETECGFVDANTVDMWRSVWWECWGVEVFLATAFRAPYSIVLGKETYKPKYPQSYLSSSNFSDSETCDALFIQSMTLMYETVALTGLQTNLENLTHLSDIGSNIFTLARQEWAYSISPNDIIGQSPTSALKRLVTRERSLFCALVAAVSILYLHASVFAHMVFDTGDDINPRPGTTKYLRSTSQAVFSFLRDSTNYYSSPTNTEAITGSSNGRPPQRSPFFACIQYFGASGSFFALSRSHSLLAEETSAGLAKIALATDFQLAETLVRKLCSKWWNSDPSADEIKKLRKQLQSISKKYLS